MSFQLKLMVAMVGLVLVVTWLVVPVSGRKIERAYSALYEERYERQLGWFEEMQEGRLAFLSEMCERAAASGELVAFLRGGGGREAFDGMREELKGVFGGGGRRPGGEPGRGDGGRTRGGGSMPVPLVCVVDGDGRLLPISGLRESGRATGGDLIRKMAVTERSDSQGVLYVAVEREEGDRVVREVVVTPVVDADGGERLGTLMVGMDPGAGASRGGSGRGRDRGGEGPVSSGIVIGGELFTTAVSPGKPVAEVADEVAARVVAGEGDDGSGERRGAFAIDHGDGRLRVHYRLLNGGSKFPEAYHVALYSLEALDAELSELRQVVLFAGACELVLALVFAFFLARKLTVPVRELAEGTGAVARGDFEVRVPVRGGDELGRLAGSFNEMAEGLAMKEKYRSVLGKVADVAVAEALVAGELELGGEEIEVSVLFCDIRGFTAIIEGKGPAEVIGLLNEHMTAMTEVVYAHCGVVDKFVGDEIMAVFGAPKAYGDDAANACRCALAMVEARARLNETAEVPLEVGIGVATGVVVAGCMGSEERLNYTVVGGRVNLASRLCGVAGACEVVVDGETWGRVEGFAGVEERVGLKGFSEEVGVWRLGKAEKLKSWNAEKLKG